MSSTIKNNDLINNVYDVSQIFSAKSYPLLSGTVTFKGRILA